MPKALRHVNTSIRSSTQNHDDIAAGDGLGREGHQLPSDQSRKRLSAVSAVRSVPRRRAIKQRADRSQSLDIGDQRAAQRLGEAGAVVAASR